ncbi:MAG TPA: zinc-binding dehydrogenase [Chloroflexota bacterium]
MQAAVFHEHGGPEVLRIEDVPRPAPGPGEVLVRVRAIAVNRTLDCEVRSRPGAYGPIPMPHILGSGPAGEVAELGEGVQGFQPGDRVVTSNGFRCGTCSSCTSGENNPCLNMRIQGVHTQGGYAEFALAPFRNLLRLPDNLSFEEATALMVMAPTAWHLLIDRAQLRAGETVLILAAGGALGTMGVQVAKLAGARVIAAAGADSKLTKARQLGADEEVNYRTSKMSDEVRRLTDGQGVDVVFENLAVPDLWAESLASAGVGGRIVTAGALGGGSVEMNMRSFYLKQLSLLGSTGAPPRQVQLVYRLAGEGKLHAVIDRCLPLAEASAAQVLVESRDIFGRVVLTVA